MSERKFSSRCGHCRQRTMELVTTAYTVQIDHDGRKYQVTVPELSVPRCASCGQFSLDSVADEQIDEAFRRQVGLLSPGEIRRSRKELGLKQEELASQLGVNVSTLSRWETGAQIQQRSLDNLMRLYFRLPVVRAVLGRASSSGRASAFPPEVRERAARFQLIPGRVRSSRESEGEAPEERSEATDSART